MSGFTGPPGTYRIQVPTTVRTGVSTSRSELVQIGIAFVVLAFDLTIIFSENTVLFGAAGFDLQAVSLEVVEMAAIAALTGFVAHELAHKVVAQVRGVWAEFRMSPMGLAISVATSYFGMLWAAPGATVVSGMAAERRADWGKTSLAGPMTNAVFSGAFYLAAIDAFLRGSGLYLWFLLLAWINGWFGTFNLVPLGPLDGRKVLRWDLRVWVAAIALTAALTFLGGWSYFVDRAPVWVW